MKVWNKRNKDWPEDAIYVGRPSPWGNKFLIGRDGDREEVIRKFECEQLPYLNLEPLRGRDLLCWCAPAPCHADILLREANK